MKIVLFLFLISHLSAVASIDILLEAIRNDDITKVQSVVTSNKALIKHKDRNGANLLAYAIRSQAVQVTDFLSKEKELILATDESGLSVLHIALVNGLGEPNIEKRYKIVQILIGAGAPLNVWDREEASVLSFAAEGSDQRIVELLILKGADVNGLRRDTALHAAVRKARSKNAEILLLHKADPNRYDEYFGHSALHAAIAQVNIANRSTYMPIIKLLLQKGADPNLPCRAKPVPFFSAKYAGFTPLHLAIMSDDPEIIKILLEAGAKLTKTPNGQAPVEIAKSDIVRSLLKNK